MTKSQDATVWEKVSALNCAVLDKTGTITKGRPEAEWSGGPCWASINDGSEASNQPLYRGNEKWGILWEMFWNTTDLTTKICGLKSQKC